jgi:uncharacterized membrane-anchored protein YjiN (DUF445 family)
MCMSARGGIESVNDKPAYLLFNAAMREQEQLVQLNKMRRIASGLLVLMACIFIAARLFVRQQPWLSYVGAFAEAAMVGALADWFAVTALFRKPLGLPIPHTAIIPSNKDRVAESLANFLEHNFITRDILGKELTRIDFAGAAARWLSHPDHSHMLARQAINGVPALLRLTEDHDAVQFMQGRMALALQQMKLAPLLAQALSILVVDRQHHALFDHLLGVIIAVLEEHQPAIREKIHEKSPRWMPKAVDNSFFQRLLDEVHALLQEMKSEDSLWRARFQTTVEGFIERLQTSDDYEQKIHTVIGQVFQHPLSRHYIDQLWQGVKQRLLADAAAEDSLAVAKLEQVLRAYADSLLRDTAQQGRVNRWISHFATDTIVNGRGFIADLVKRVIRQWDAETVSRKFELYVGKDLQYIRINGTLVGGLVGLLLHLVSLAL